MFGLTDAAVLFFSTIPILIQYFAFNYIQDDMDIQLEPSVTNGTYDFIVVGAGTAGSIVASRLSENYNVFLLEAGGSPPPQSDHPFYCRMVEQDPDLNMFFDSIPQKNAKWRGGILRVIGGKMLGGSGSHNDLVHNRGSPGDYDNWAKITKDKSWKYENVLKYFKKYENFIGKKYGNESDDFYGKDGPITVDTNVVPLLPIWLKAGKELGYNIGDPNGFQREGFAPTNKAILRGKRCSSYTGFIQPIQNSRDTLTIVKYANVSKILLKDNKQAYGVEYTRHGGHHVAIATKEIIISAGIFSSPLLLMKSGIGPVETLKEAEIPVKIPLEAVGKNFAEHPTLILTPFRVHKNQSHLFDKIDNEKTVLDLEKEFRKGKGILGRVSHGPQAFIASSKAPKTWPDLWIEIHPIVGLQKERQVINIYVVLGRPKSKGSVKLNTDAYKEGIRDDTQLALIDFNLLDHPDDVDVMVEGIKFAFKVAEETKAFRELGMVYDADPEPECKEHDFRSDEYWKCVLVQNVRPWIHMGGTCSLGPKKGSTKTYVLDSKFRVRGAKGLRVVDGSSMPEIPNANTNAPIQMLAEKAADEINTFWVKKETKILNFDLGALGF